MAYLVDTDGDDVISGKGNDTIYLQGKGNDVVDVKGGDYNQVDLDGKASDYSFKRNADGTITVSSAATGTDLLKNIHGFWFNGEGKWYSADQLAPLGGGEDAADVGGKVITGTSGNDYLSDTKGDDVIKAGAGNDVIYLSHGGNDTVDGEGGDYNQVDLDGKASDYSFKRNADGTITVSSAATGTDLLKNIHGFWFNGEGKWYSADQLAPLGGAKTTNDDSGEKPAGQAGGENAITGTSGNDYLSDTKGDDVIKAGAGNDVIYLGHGGNDTVDGEGGDYNQVDLDGKASDYTFKFNADGAITVSSAATGTDLLKNIHGFWFNGEGKWYSAEQLATGAHKPVVSTPGSESEPAGKNKITGTSGNDYLSDTKGDDVIKAGGGNDVIYLGGKGNDIVDGEGGDYNQVDLNGKASDYSFTRNADGTITVSSAATGTDLLKNIHGFWFNGEGKWYSADQLAGSGGHAGPNPDAIDDSVKGVAGKPITGNVLDNDAHLEGQDLTLKVFTQPAHGAVTLNQDGTFTYVPEAGFVGNDSFEYEFINAQGYKDCATVNVEVCEPEPKPIKPEPDQLKLCEDSSATINVLDNDGGSGLKLISVKHETSTLDSLFASRGGKVSFDADGNVTYTGMKDYYGKDKLVYTVQDSTGKTYTQTVDVTIDAASDAPTIDVADVYQKTYVGSNNYTANHINPGETKVITTDFFGAFSDAADALQQFGVNNTGGADDRDQPAYVRILSGDSSAGVWKWNGEVITPGQQYYDIPWSDIVAGKLTFTQAAKMGNTITKLEFQVIDSGNDSAEACCTGYVVSNKDFFNIWTPIVLDLDGSGKIEVTGETSSKDKTDVTKIGKTVQFDIDADGQLDKIEWVTGGGDGILIDASKVGPNGEIDGSALFGDEGGKFANGYDKLKLHDANGDGVISGAELDTLALWIDDGDAVLQAGEMKTAAEAGIASISADMTIAYDAAGRELMQSSATTFDGHEVLTEDVWFAEDASDLDAYQIAQGEHLDQHAH